MASSTGEGGARTRRPERCARVSGTVPDAHPSATLAAVALLASALLAGSTVHAAHLSGTLPDTRSDARADARFADRTEARIDAPVDVRADDRPARRSTVAANGGARDRYASVEASVSPRGAAGETFRTVPVPLARSDASGKLVSRTGRPAPGTSDCRWPDEGTLAAILPVATDRGSHASGVVFATDRVLTAAHAIADGGATFVRIGGGFRRADLLLMDAAADLAVLRVDTRGIAPLPIVDREPAERQTVWAVGYPREAGRTTSSGVFQRNRAGALHTSAPIDSGQSGGGLLACEHGDFRLLGMLRGYGAYRNGDTYVKLDNHSVSVAGATIHRVLAGRAR